MDLLNQILYKDESYKIIGACMEVHKNLGCGFLEAIYQEALEIEFADRMVPYEREKTLKIYYKGKLLDKDYRSDFICFDSILIELKALDKLTPEHTAQVLNYLKATNYKLGILINFGRESLEFKRILL
ncbi:MAG: GxxExxY protein [Bacteroidales bacterium]|nr:GxxExxY protein [Bacteroidales bacterium]MDD4685381.1 GxxExxY protein [Bacteroidales bacterium]